MTFSWEIFDEEELNTDLSDTEKERLEERIIRYISSSIKTEQQIRLNTQLCVIKLEHG